MICIEQELKKVLTDFASSNKMSLEEVSQLTKMMLNRETILEQHRSPVSQNERDKRWRTRLPNGRQIVKTHYDDLLDVLVEYYSGLPSKGCEPALQTPPLRKAEQLAPARTLKTLYPEWLELRRLEVSKSTLADDIRNWEKYILPSRIAELPLEQLTKPVLKTWAYQIVTENCMKKKYYDNIRTVLNSLLDYAADAEYIEANKFRAIRLNGHLYKPAAFKEENEEAFTRREQELVMREAEEDSRATDSALPLGICILFCTGIRVGELCGLQYGDIKGDYLYINRMVVENQTETPTGLKHCGYKIVDHAKTNAGHRRIYLTEKARTYLRQIRELNEKNGFPVSDTDLVFQRKEGLCNQRVFDGRIKKYCNPNHLNLPFAKSCHDIRRSYISHLFDLGLNPDEIRRMAGHENIEMTMRYCRGRKSQEELNQILEADASPAECNKV
ncbi:MAG: site-specific integrase [Firmicutes bacterium]|nr:site-specific integrase [Bacillota bacterium]